MADFFSILSNSYKTAPTPSSSPREVCLRSIPIRITAPGRGRTPTGEKFSFSISDVQGFRAKVKYQSGTGPVRFQDVLIKDNSFRIGDTKFLLKKIGHAEIKTVVTNPATGGTVLNTAYADLVGSRPQPPADLRGN